LPSRESRCITLSQTIPPSEVDRSVNLKLVSEGHGWLAAVLYHKQVIIPIFSIDDANNFSDFCFS
jgi:hypothetical protein